MISNHNMAQTQDRNNVRLVNTYGASRLAFPWIQMNESSVENSKECNVCWESCTKYLLCSEHENHCVCSDCAYKMVENRIIISPQGSIDIKWKCPICRQENPLGCWQFLPEKTSSINLSKSAPTQAETRPITQTEPLSNYDPIPHIPQQPEQQHESRMPPSRQPDTRPPLWLQGTTMRVHPNSTSNELNDTWRLKWIMKFKWPNSKVNDFKAWYIFHNRSKYYCEMFDKDLTKWIKQYELNAAKERYDYDDLKNSPEAPWWCFRGRMLKWISDLS